MNDQILTQELVKELLHYNPETGIFTWKCRDKKWFSDRATTRTIKSWNSRYSGKVAGSMHNEGYIEASIFKSPMLLHRVAWLYVNGSFPEHDIDHINHVRTDNRICNLRDVTRSVNLKNRSICKRNKSGVVGVNFNYSQKKWHSKLNHEMKSVWLGSFDDKFEAICARKSAELMYGYHENHGKANVS